MFVLCSLLLLSTAPDADPTVHAPPPCRTPAELHALCSGQRGWPDPLFHCTEADFQLFFDGTLNAYSRDPDRQQAWLDAFAVFVERLEPRGKMGRPSWILAAKQRLAREVVAAYSSSPPHSCERAAQVLLAYFGRYDEIIEPGIEAVVGDLVHPDPARACWAASVLRVLLSDNLRFDFAPAQLHAKTLPDGPYRYETSERPVDRAVADLLGKLPSIHEQLATLGFAHDSYDAIWLIGLLPPDQAFAVLESHLRAPNDLLQLQFTVAALSRSDWRRVKKVIADSAAEILAFLAKEAETNELTFGPASYPLLHGACPMYSRFHSSNTFPFYEWLSEQLNSGAILAACKRDLALWMSNSGDDQVRSVLASTLDTDDANSALTPYAAVALCKHDPQKGLPYIREYVASSWLPDGMDWTDGTRDPAVECLGIYGTRGDMKLIAAKNGTRGDGRSLASIALCGLVIRTNSEAAWLGLLDLAAEKTLSDAEVSALLSLPERRNNWPSTNVKDAYYAFFRELFEKPATRGKTVGAWLDTHQPETRAEFITIVESLAPEVREPILHQIAQSQNHSAPTLLKEIRLISDDPVVKSQIGEALKKMSRGTALQFVPDSPLIVAGPIIRFWEIVALALVIAGGGLILYRLRHRHTGGVSA